jgi:predicted nucleic acid-binding protein
MILVDTNVIVDLLRGDPVWRDWSEQQLIAARHTDKLAINAVIYAELAAIPRATKVVDEFLDHAEIGMQAFSKDSARLAGQAFYKYRARKGTRTGVLPDFFIGAQAQAEGWTLLTRDAARYKTYFAPVRLICP